MARVIRDRSDAVPLIAEVFREFGYEGASLSKIYDVTGLGKGSIYNFFPGGKHEMAAAVLTHVEDYFEQRIFGPLSEMAPGEGLDTMWRETDRYFNSGGRVCLVGAFALDATRDRFASKLNDYFARWIAVLKEALCRANVDDSHAGVLAEHAVLTIQGALVLSRGLGDRAIFIRTLERLRSEFAEVLSQARCNPPYA